MNRRIIARLDIKGPNLVKGVHLEGLRVLGKPEHFARYYCNHGADELFYMDVVASLYNRNSLSEIVTRTAQESLIPLTVGGGIRTIEDIRTALRAGADKVALNTAVLRNPDLIRQASEHFGASTIIVSIEAIRQKNGRYLAFTENGREPTTHDAIDWAQQAAELGAGEILITSVDREGTGQGMDTVLLNNLAACVNIPIIASGGIGKASHVSDVLSIKGIDAVACASLFHYDFIENHPMVGDFSSEGNTDFLRNASGRKQITPCAIEDLKTFLANQGIPVRREKESAE